MCLAFWNADGHPVFLPRNWSKIEHLSFIEALGGRVVYTTHTHTQKFVESLCLCSFEGKIPDAVFISFAQHIGGVGAGKTWQTCLTWTRTKMCTAWAVFKFQWVVAKINCRLTLSSVRPGKVKRLMRKRTLCRRSLDMLHWNDPFSPFPSNLSSTSQLLAELLPGRQIWCWRLEHGLHESLKGHSFFSQKDLFPGWNGQRGEWIGKEDPVPLLNINEMQYIIQYT